LIRKIKVSTASEHDTLHMDEVLDTFNTGRTFMATKAIWTKSAKHDSRRQVFGFMSNARRPKANRCPTAKSGRNTRIAKTRARVEHVFASLGQMGGKGLRCIGLDRVTLQLNFKAATYNLRRLCSLKTCEIKSAFAF